MLVIVLLVVLVAGGYAAAHQVAGDKVPRGTSVSGIDIGGLTRADAIAELEDAFGARAAEPIRVEVDGGRSDDVRPDEVGLAIDYAATVDAAGAGDSWSPRRSGTTSPAATRLDAIVDVDETLLSARLAELSEGLGVPPKNGRINFKDGRVNVIDPVPGEAVDIDAAAEAITAAFLGGEDSAELTVTTAQPDIDETTSRRRSTASPTRRCRPR